MFAVQIACLEKAFEQWREYLREGGYQSESTEQFYERCLSAPFNENRLQAALFDVKKFPRLSDIGIGLAGMGVQPGFLPKEWEPPDVASRVDGNPLAQFLLGYVWKLGKYREVGNVIAGFLDSHTPSARGSEETAVVMRQFGRHLASPTSQPIFDQHTARFLYVYQRSNVSMPIAQLAAEAALKKWTSADCDAYVDWWLGSPIRGLSPVGQVWADRVMFSLGKAVKILGSPPET